ncbi:methyltransferase domain-containing protein [Bradyrhizobium elkanii]|uniref:methyltransferase domain-containing protein n=1 Tax=Bradyrhizobium elkanii TaxID=29448 RepID=UPI0009B658F5|nr:methyltransferase domain-containing protein [Bradyrhizobium elkanii]
MTSMNPDSYLLGQSSAEVERLKRQIVMLASDSDAQLDRIGIKNGESVVDLGCGPGGVLHLLAERVGANGKVLGIDRSSQFVQLARRFIGDRGLPQVEVREGDAYDTGLPKASFDGAHMRLLLVNVPEPERIVRELVSLVRPGGWIASFEADYVAHCLDPPPPAWARLLDAYAAYARAQGIDLSVGRHLHRLFRDAGVVDIQVDATINVFPASHERRTFPCGLIGNVRDRVVEGGFISRESLERDIEALEQYLSRPDVQVTSNLFFRLTGRLPK